jgi:hypothetical protein
MSYTNIIYTIQMLLAILPLCCDNTKKKQILLKGMKYIVYDKQKTFKGYIKKWLTSNVVYKNK